MLSDASFSTFFLPNPAFIIDFAKSFKHESAADRGGEFQHTLLCVFTTPAAELDVLN